MVLAEEGGAVAVEAQRLGERADVVGALAGVAGEGGGDLGDAAHVVHVVVAAGEQRGARGRAERGGVELVVAKAVGGEGFGGRHVDGAAEGARHAEAHVVDEDDDDVGRAFGRLDFEARRRRGVAGVEDGAVRIVGLGDGETGAVHRVRIGACGGAHGGPFEHSFCIQFGLR